MNRSFYFVLIWAVCSAAWGVDELLRPLADLEQDEVPFGTISFVEVEVDPVEALVGDIIRLRMEVVHAQQAHVEVLHQQAAWGELEILETTPMPFETLPDGRIRRELTFKMAAYSTGEFTIPSLPIQTVIEGVETELRTPPIAVQIRSLLPEDIGEAALRDIKPQERLFGEIHIAYLIAALAVFALVLLAAYLYVRRRRMQREAEAPPIPAHVRALEALQALRQEREIFERRQVETFSIRVSEILRVYIQEKYGIPALDYTSSEILSTLDAVLGDSHLASETKRDLHTFFEECDLIKFARHELAEEGMFGLIDIAEAWVRTTSLSAEDKSGEPLRDNASEEAATAEKTTR